MFAQIKVSCESDNQDYIALFDLLTTPATEPSSRNNFDARHGTVNRRRGAGLAFSRNRRPSNGGRGGVNSLTNRELNSCPHHLFPSN